MYHNPRAHLVSLGKPGYVDLVWHTVQLNLDDTDFAGLAKICMMKNLYLQELTISVH